MSLQLLGQQVPLGNLQLFLVGIAGQLNDFHPVQQRPGNGVQGVGGSDEQNVGQIEGHLQEVIPEGGVLLSIQHLQQRGGRVAPLIVAQLINFIQQQQRIATPRLSDCRDNPAGHSPHIGLAVTPDLRLIVDAAQRDPGHIPVDCFSHTGSNGGLAHARRPYQTENLSLQLRCQLLDGQKFQNPGLDLFQAEVVSVQGLAGGSHVYPLLGLFAPGQLQYSVQVIAEHGGLSRTKGLLFQAAQLLFQLLLHLNRQFSLFYLPPVVIELLVSPLLVLPQLVLEYLQLFPQHIVALAAGQLVPYLALHLLLQLQDLHLPAEILAELLQAAHRAQLLQDCLLVPCPHGQILGDIVGNVTGVLAGEHRKQDIGGHFGRQINISLKQLIGLPDQRLCTGRTLYRSFRRNLLHLGAEIGGGLHHLAQAATADALHHHPHIVAGQAQDLAHVADGAHGIQVPLLGIFDSQLPLGHKKDGLAAGHGLVQSLDGALSAHVEVEQHIGENSKTTQGQGRHDHRHIFFHLVPPLYRNRSQKPETAAFSADLWLRNS